MGFLGQKLGEIAAVVALEGTLSAINEVNKAIKGEEAIRFGIRKNKEITVDFMAKTISCEGMVLGMRIEHGFGAPKSMSVTDNLGNSIGSVTKEGKKITLKIPKYVSATLTKSKELMCKFDIQYADLNRIAETGFEKWKLSENSDKRKFNLKNERGKTIAVFHRVYGEKDRFIVEITDEEQIVFRLLVLEALFISAKRVRRRHSFNYRIVY